MKKHGFLSDKGKGITPPPRSHTKWSCGQGIDYHDYHMTRPKSEAAGAAVLQVRPKPYPHQPIRPHSAVFDSLVVPK